MRALVTGASGFIGSHLVEALVARGDRVRALVRSVRHFEPLALQGAEPALGDLRDPASLRAALDGVDVVFHLASRVTDWGPWSAFNATTVQGTRNVLEAAAEARVARFVHFSTVNVYDDRFARRHRVLTEDAPHAPPGDRHFGRYARAKSEAEMLVWDFHRRGAVEAVVLRPSLVYGPRDEAVLPRLIDYLRSPLAAWIGRENPTVDPIEVGDVVRCALAAAEAPNAAGRAYNVSPSCEIGVRDFYRAVCQALDIRPPRITLPYSLVAAATVALENGARLLRTKQPPTMTWAGLSLFAEDRHYDPARARGELGWQANVPLAEGMQRYAAWLSAQQPWHHGSRGSFVRQRHAINGTVGK